ncbi:MAG: hypothetical protein D6741_12265 [Planctomycetota bacterium]|nr:MAG: hypothetical protein D6741_12265 [Planctomycetota bacterium]
MRGWFFVVINAVAAATMVFGGLLALYAPSVIGAGEQVFLRSLVGGCILCAVSSVAAVASLFQWWTGRVFGSVFAITCSPAVLTFGAFFLGLFGWIQAFVLFLQS